jgi:hypothetical protein
MRGRTCTRARAGGLFCAVGVLALVVTACTQGGGTATPGGASYVSQASTALAAGQTPWFCKSQGLGGNMSGGHDANPGMANDAYAGRSKGTLSAADCKANAQTFDTVLAYAKRYPTKSAAAAAGFVEMVQHVNGMGTHHMTGSFGTPPGNPFFLQYDGEAATAPLDGMSWFTSSLMGPPAGFAGDNDWWHSHTSLCYTTAAGLTNTLPGGPSFGVAGNEITDAECSAKGGMNLKLPGIWMGHAWIVPGYEDRYDVFAGAMDCIKGTGPPAANDPCHDAATGEMEHGGGGSSTPPSTDGHGHTDADHAAMTTTTAAPPMTMWNPFTTTTAAPTVTTAPTATTTTTMASMPGMDHSH